jgi:hypothetical protein
MYCDILVKFINLIKKLYMIQNLFHFVQELKLNIRKNGIHCRVILSFLYSLIIHNSNSISFQNPRFKRGYVEIHSTLITLTLIATREKP